MLFSANVSLQLLAGCWQSCNVIPTAGSCHVPKLSRLFPKYWLTSGGTWWALHTIQPLHMSLIKRGATVFFLQYWKSFCQNVLIPWYTIMLWYRPSLFSPVTSVVPIFAISTTADSNCKDLTLILFSNWRLLLIPTGENKSAVLFLFWLHNV